MYYLLFIRHPVHIAGLDVGPPLLLKNCPLIKLWRCLFKKNLQQQLFSIKFQGIFLLYTMGKITELMWLTRICQKHFCVMNFVLKNYKRWINQIMIPEGSNSTSEFQNALQYTMHRKFNFCLKMILIHKKDLLQFDYRALFTRCWVKFLKK